MIKILGGTIFWGGVYTKTFLYENGTLWFRFAVPFALKRREQKPKTITIESGSIGGNIRKRSHKIRVNSENDAVVENDDVVQQKITWCSFDAHSWLLWRGQKSFDCHVIIQNVSFADSCVFEKRIRVNTSKTMHQKIDLETDLSKTF